jgi:hypothetical protein
MSLVPKYSLSPNGGARVRPGEVRSEPLKRVVRGVGQDDEHEFPRSPTRDDHPINLQVPTKEREREDAVEVPTKIDALDWLRKHLDADGSDLLP